MDSIDATCAICFLGYNAKARKPLVLSCSHSFCQACLEKLATEDSKVCPNCRGDWKKCEVKNLLPCLQLIPNREKEREKVTDKCEDHDQDITIWCNTCRVQICLKCLRMKHKTCNWMLMEEKYEEMVAKLTKRVTRNDGSFQSLDGFTKKLRSCCDKLAEWKSKAEQELGHPLGKEGEISSKVPVGKLYQKTLALVEIERTEPSDQFTKLLHDVAKAFQETNDGNQDTFIKKLKASKKTTSSESETVAVGFSFGIGAEKSATFFSDNSLTSAVAQPGRRPFGAPLFGFSPPTNSKRKEIPAFESGGKWIIKNDSEVAEACEALKDSFVKPSEVSIVVGDIATEKKFEHLLSLIARTTCLVSFMTLYSHWKSHPKPELTDVCGTQLTLSRLRCLVLSAPPHGSEHWCTLTEFGGHLDVEGLKLLPKDLKSIGLVLEGEKDMEVLREVIEVEYGRWLWKQNCTYLNTLQLAVAKTFQPDWWSMQQAPKCSSFFNPPAPDLSKSRTVLKASLHLPKLLTDQDLDWMKRMLVKIKDSHLEIGSLTDLYLPGTTIDKTKIHVALKDCGLDTALSLLTVHLPIDNRNIFSLNTNEKIGNCNFAWDLAKL